MAVPRLHRSYDASGCL